MSKPKVYILSGKKHKGKTSYAFKLAAGLKAQNHQTGGFLAPGKFEKNRRSEFNILDLNSGKQKLLCSVHLDQGEEIGPFRFDADGQKFGHDLLLPENLKDIDFIFIDEIGPLEMKDKGWTPSINRLMTNPDYTLIWIVRENLVSEVIKKWKLIDVNVFDINEQSAEEVASFLLK
jgi:nucleoside-triphosphatase THEP1